jgi:hypothetical protein
MREQEASKLYMRELLCSMAIYAAILVGSLYFGRPMAPGTARLLVLLSPMLGFVLMLWALVRQFRRMDEFIRQLFLENAAIAAGITAGLTFTYGFLEGAGYPRLSMFTVWVLLCACLGLTATVRRLAMR